MTIKFSDFPSDVQTDVIMSLREDRRDEANHKMRYYRNHGHTNAMAYRNEVMQNFKPSPEHMKTAVIEVMVKRFKSNGYKLEQWMEQIPNAQNICSTAFTPNHC